MNSHDVLASIVSLILGGGLWKGIESLIKGISGARRAKAVAESIGAKTPVEIESLSVATMKVSLESAQSQIESLEAQRDADKLYYQGRIKELTDQLERVRGELQAVQDQLTDLLRETDTMNTQPR